jgi:hypothetical protein
LRNPVALAALAAALLAVPGLYAEALFTRPAPEALYGDMLHGSSLMSPEARRLAAEAGRRMDLAHLESLRANGRDVRLEAERSGWVHPEVGRWPLFGPKSERALASLLNLQADMLHAVLSARDQPSALALDRQRHQHRVRQPSERFYGDFRDRYVCMVLDLLSNINAYQHALGAAQRTDWDFPTNARTADEAERYVLERLEFVAQQAHALAAAGKDKPR